MIDTSPSDVGARTPRQQVKFWAACGLAFAVWAVTPACWALVALSGGRRGAAIPLIVWIYALCEVPFSLYLWHLRTSTQALLTPPKLDASLLEALLDRCLGHSGLAGGQDGVFLRRILRWFPGSTLEDVHKDNVREWLAWAFAGSELSKCKDDLGLQRLVDRGLSIIEERTGHAFPSGYNAHCTALRLTLDPVRSLSRPLGYYVVCNGFSGMTRLWLRLFKGFQLQKHGACTFLVLPRCRPSPRGRGSNADAPDSGSYADHPILFIHGLGVGLGQYVVFLRHLATHQAGVVILLQPHISVDIWHHQFLAPPSKDEHVQAIELCARANKFEDMTLLSHSNGTMVHGWLSRDAPTLVFRHIFVDPVCFRLWEGATCFAFMAKRWSTDIEVLLGYFVAREVGVSYTISRKFIWWDMLLWIEDLGSLGPDRLRVVIGEKDVLIDVDATREYLAAAGVSEDSVQVCPGHQHGQALFLPSKGMHAVLQLFALR